MMLDGYDIVDGAFRWDELKAQFDEWTAQMSLSVHTKEPVSSVFEVGCGAGPNLMLYQRLMGLRVGGVDYSQALLDYARSVVDSAELYCGQATQIDPTKKYDVVMSFSVFHYFPDHAYAKIVLRRMIEKAERTVAVLAVHDQSREEAFYAYRRAIEPDYDERYRDTPKLFYPKEFFIQLAEETGCDIKFTASRAEHYWNKDFIFNVYLYINPNGKTGLERE